MPAIACKVWGKVMVTSHSNSGKAAVASHPYTAVALCSYS
jgi:hypothetical protein